MNKKRILAILGLILIFCLYAATLILALLDSPFARQCLMAALYCSFFLPVTIYAYTRFLHFRDKKK